MTLAVVMMMAHHQKYRGISTEVYVSPIAAISSMRLGLQLPWDCDGVIDIIGQHTPGRRDLEGCWSG